MTMTFMTIGGPDITEYLDFQNYEMNSEPVYTSWTDGNLIEHRITARNRIIGEVTAGFKSSTEFATFMNLLSTVQQADGYYVLTAFIQNTNTTEQFNAFIDITTTAKWDFINSREWHECKMSIRQR